MLLAAALRLPLNSGFRFHPDEALYATWARLIATGQDVWLAARIVDKPPLFSYALAALFATVGASEEIARIPSQLASLAAVALVYGIAVELYHDRRLALLAALTLALSPFAILFAPTAFTDPLMVCFALAAFWFGLRRRAVWCGLCFGLSVATKQ
ncbi:MAG: glycosyltransferase family 39 protein, partial [Chloroflexota bacterium]